MKIRFGAGRIRISSAPGGKSQAKSGLAQGKVGFSLRQTDFWHGKSGWALRPSESCSSQADLC
jgi:hypothetical protein